MKLSFQKRTTSCLQIKQAPKGGRGDKNKPKNQNNNNNKNPTKNSDIHGQKKAKFFWISVKSFEETSWNQQHIHKKIQTQPLKL